MNITAGYHPTNRKIDTGKTLTRWPVFVDHFINVLAAIVILCAGVFVARAISSGLRRVLRIKSIDETIIQFSSSLIRYAVLTFSFIAALGRVGVETSSIIAVIGAAGLAIGLALQGSLANFAAGILLVSLRPFKTGELVQFGDTVGFVDEINIFFTHIKTTDNKIIAAPNGKIISGEIINYSRHPHRRVEIIVSVSYGTNNTHIKHILSSVVNAETRVLHNLDKIVRLSEMGSSSLNYTVRVWVQNKNYWDVYFDLLENIKNALDENEVCIPYPQMDVHLYNK
jgi:small conductance mechanosensitive channel